MYNWYGVLDIKSGASDEAINAGFLRTVTRLHPDRGATPDPRLRLVVRAYDTLSDPDRRSTYDAALANRYAQVRQARRAKATTFATTLTLTLCCALTAVLWREQGETLALDLTPAAASEAVAASTRSAEPATFTFAAARNHVSDSAPQGRVLR